MVSRIRPSLTLVGLLFLLAQLSTLAVGGHGRRVHFPLQHAKEDLLARATGVEGREPSRDWIVEGHARRASTLQPLRQHAGGSECVHYDRMAARNNEESQPL